MLWYNSVNDLENFLKNDKDMNSLSPIRIINVNNLADWTNTRKVLRNITGNQIGLSSLCLTEDNTPNIKRLYKLLDESTGSSVVIPLSEYLRLYPEQINTVISKLLTREYSGFNGQQKFYFLMYRMQEHLLALNMNDPRRSQCIICLRGNLDRDFKLNVVNSSLTKTGLLNEIRGFKYYLLNWENEPAEITTLLTEHASFFKTKVFSDNIIVVDNAFDLLKMRGFIHPKFKFEDAVKYHWERLLADTVDVQSFEKNCQRFFFVPQYDLKVFDKWTSYDDFGKWLLWMWTRLQPNSYVSYCANRSRDINEFVTSLYTAIIDFLNTTDFDEKYNERKEILGLLKIQPPSSFWSILSNLSVVERLKVLTDISIKEKSYIISLFHEIDFARRSEVIKLLRVVYPELSYYLDNVSGLRDCLTHEHKEYFDTYRWFKISNCIGDTIYNKAQYFAKQKGESVFKLSARNALINQEYDNNTGIVFIDALGIEYVDLIAYELSTLSKDEYSVRYACGYCLLPSVTSINKDFLEGKNVIWQTLDLDHLKHGVLGYPDNILKEFDSIKATVDKIKATLEDRYNKLIIASDHGSSRLAVLSRNSRFDNKLTATEGCTVYKHGRYCDSTDIGEDIEMAINYNDKMIIADYSRFEQKGAPGVEIHGGATLEEWLVPIITIEKNSSNVTKISKSIDVILEKKSFAINPKTRCATIEFYVDEFDDELEVRIHSEIIQCKKEIAIDTKQYYSFVYKPYNGEETIEAEVATAGINSSFVFSIKKGIKQNAGFDI